MTADTPSRPDASLSGASMAGLALIARRPGLLATWTLLGFIPAVAVIAGVRGLAVGFPIGIPVLLFVGAILVRLVSDILQCAAYRAVLRPEMTGWGLVRLGGAEGRVMMLNFTRSPQGVPLEVTVGLFAMVLALAGLGALASVLAGPIAGAGLFALAFLCFLIGIQVASVRGSLVAVAAFIGMPEPRDAGWLRGERRTLSMVGNALAVMALCLAGAALVLGLWRLAASALPGPNALWARALPADAAGWAGLAAEVGLLALAISLTLAWFTAIGAPVTAETWRRLGGPLAVQARRRLFEEP